MDPDNYLHIVDCVAGKLGPVKTIDEIFRVQEKHGISLWIMETGQIEKSIGPFIKFEMVRRQVFLNIVLVAPTKDKRARARPLQMRMRAGGVKFDKLGDWYPAYEMEMLQFDRSSRDDRVDATAWLGLYLDQLQGSLTVKELQEEEWENEERESLGDQGRSVVTGY
jgi:predicted phage terminase large subunit-like protein